MRAPFIGGPCEGKFIEVPDDLHYYRVARATPLLLADFSDIEPVGSAFVTGEYRLGWFISGPSDPPHRAWEWLGWDDEPPRPGRPSPRPGPSWVPPTAWDACRRPTEEPGPDAMRWTPDVADAEIEEWQRILHPTR